VPNSALVWQRHESLYVCAIGPTWRIHGIRDQGRLNFGISDEVDSDMISAPFPMDQWKHVAGTFEASSGSLKLYLDGVLVAQGHTARRPARGDS